MRQVGSKEGREAKGWLRGERGRLVVREAGRKGKWLRDKRVWVQYVQATPLTTDPQEVLEHPILPRVLKSLALALTMMTYQPFGHNQIFLLLLVGKICV